jgi:hypothetical protein
MNTFQNILDTIKRGFNTVLGRQDLVSPVQSNVAGVPSLQQTESELKGKGLVKTPQGSWTRPENLATPTPVPTPMPTAIPGGSPYDTDINKHFMNEATNAFLTLKNENAKLDPRAQNVNPDGSIDRGIFQINNQTYLDLLGRKGNDVRNLGINSFDDLYDAAKNIQMAKLLYDDRASWDESGWNAWYGAPDSIIGPKEKERRIKLGIGVRN